MNRLSLDLQTLTTLYQSGEASPVDVVREIYDRIRNYSDKAVWIHLRAEAELIAQAKALGDFDPGKPLFGIPFAIKDNIDAAGMPTTAACPDFAYTPEASAAAVQTLLDAGAILVGKTNLDQFATGLVGTRSPYGAPSCVFDERYISGGSSSGSAVAVAAGLVSFALGTDTAGSGRVPAGFNNLVGWKPTRGLLSTRGVVPACRSLDCVSVFSLTVDDAQSIAQVMSQFDAQDPFSRPKPANSKAFNPQQSFRFGLPSAEQLEFFGDKEAERLFKSAIERLESLGGIPVKMDFRPFEEAAELLYAGPWVAERLAAVTPFIDTHPEAFYPTTLKIIEGGRNFSAVDAFRAAYRLEDLRRQAEAEWQQMDLMLLPTSGTIFSHKEVAAEPVQRNTDLGRYTNFVNLLDLSGVAVPAGFRPNGLPFGVTLLAPAFSDDALIQLAARMQASLGGELGGTGVMLESLQVRSASQTASPNSPFASQRIELAVVGAHLSGLPLNHQLLDCGAQFVRTDRTTPDYRLFALPDSQPEKPGLIRDLEADGPGIEVEIWSLSAEAFGSFCASIPAPLGIGTIQLADGSPVKGFLCEPHAVLNAEEITWSGGWRSYLGIRTAG